jgi:hypothetical protein
VRIVKVAARGLVPRLLAASSRSGRLVVAYATVDGNGIRVVRGNADGAGSRVVARTRNASVWVVPNGHAVFVPAGVVVVTPRSPNAYTSGVLITLVAVPR